MNAHTERIIARQNSTVMGDLVSFVKSIFIIKTLGQNFLWVISYEWMNEWMNEYFN